MSTETAVSAKSHQYYPAIDGLRAIAVSAVLLYHVANTLLPGGFAGVDMFFVISGFVVTASLRSLPRSSLSQLCAAFYARRILRIAPALLVCLVVTAACAALVVPKVWLSDTNHKTGFAAFVGLSNFVLAFFTGDYFAPRAEFNPFTHTWSLGVEEQFYLLFPLLMAGRASRERVQPSRLIVSVLVVASLACAAWLSKTKPVYAFYLLPARLWELGVGVLAWLLIEPVRGLLRSQSPRRMDGLAGLALAGVGASFVVCDPAQFPMPWALLPVLSTAVLLMLLVAAGGGRVERMLAARLPTWLGLRSYSLYLWHWPVIVLMRWTVGINSPLTQCVAVVVSLALAAASYALVEHPIRTSPRLKRSARPLVLTFGFSAIAGAAVIAGVMFKLEPRISMSVTSNLALWFPFAEADVGSNNRCARVRDDKTSFSGGKLTRFSADGCSAGKEPGSVFVLGDSHAASYDQLLKRYVAQTGRDVLVFHKSGCAAYNFMSTKSDASADCQVFLNAATDYLSKNVVAGDTVFLASLKLRRLIDQWTIPSTDLDELLHKPDLDRSQAVAEVNAFMRPLAARGASIILEAPKPLAPSPAFRCSDWFNHMNPACKLGRYIDRGEMETYRQAALAATKLAAAGLRNVTVWDPFPLLCESTRCGSYRYGQPVIFDGDHLTGFANELLVDSFVSHVHSVLAQAN